MSYPAHHRAPVRHYRREWSLISVVAGLYLLAVTAVALL